MIIRLKIESFYELPTDFATIEEAKAAMENDPHFLDDYDDANAFVGRDYYIEDAEAHRNLHNYTQVDM